MSTASHYAEIRARFFPQARPIVMADPVLWRARPLEPPKMVRRLIDSKTPIRIPPAPMRIERVLKMACIFFDCTKAELVGDGRDAPLVSARIYVSVRLKKEFGFSRARIGQILNRDQSTIFNLLAKAAGVGFNASGKRRMG